MQPFDQLVRANKSFRSWRIDSDYSTLNYERQQALPVGHHPRNRAIVTEDVSLNAPTALTISLLCSPCQCRYQVLIHARLARGNIGSVVPIALHPARDTLFALIEGRPVLFSESNQKIYELDRMGAYVWCKLLEEETIDTIIDGLTGFGIDRSRARQFISQATHRWLDLALVDVDWEFPVDFALRARLGGHTIRIQASNEQLLERLAPLFCSASRGADGADVLVEVAELDDWILFRVDHGSICQCESAALAPAIKARLTECIIRLSPSDIALHAASLINNREGLLLCGQPGAGKSTLALHLTEAGFHYGGDDVVLMAPDGSGRGLPFAPTVKPGSWEMISKLRNDLDDAILYCRPDGVHVRYLPVGRVHHGIFSINLIIFLNRVEGNSTKITSLGQIDSMRRVIAGSFAVDGSLSRSAFIALKRTLARAKSFELTYSDAAQARTMLVDLCHGQP